MNQSEHSPNSASSLAARLKQQDFREWVAESYRLQIAAVAFLTAILYMVFGGINVLFVDKKVLETMLAVHLYLLPPLLFVISLLAYKGLYGRLMRALLFAASVIAAAAQTYIVIQMPNPGLYLTEVYLIIFWTFTVSGLALLPAALSALSSALISAVAVSVALPLTSEMLALHLFWIFVTYSFGLLGAYLLEYSLLNVYESRKKMEALATTDRLTGLYNRTKLDADLDEELKRAERFGHALGLIMMDVDYFKQINDRYGHQMGDVVLRNLSEQISTHVRSVDSVYRWGGEEIVILCLEIDQAAIMDKAEMLRRLIEEHHCTAFKENITASFGVTLCRESDTAAGVVQRADRAMYRAKNLGRNRVEML